MPRYYTYRNKGFESIKYNKIKDSILDEIDSIYAKYGLNTRVNVVFGGVFAESMHNFITVGQALRTSKYNYEIRISNQVLDEMYKGNNKLLRQTLIHEFAHIYDYTYVLSSFKKYNPLVKVNPTRNHQLMKIGYMYYSELFAYFESYSNVKKVKGSKVKEKELITIMKQIKRSKDILQSKEFKNNSKKDIQGYLTTYKETIDNYVYLLSKYVAYRIAVNNEERVKDVYLNELMDELIKCSINSLSTTKKEEVIVRLGRIIYNHVYLPNLIKIKSISDKYVISIDI